jgi:hypothetical protein
MTTIDARSENLTLLTHREGLAHASLRYTAIAEAEESIYCCQPLPEHNDYLGTTSFRRHPKGHLG